MKTSEFVKQVEELGLKVGDWLSGKGICVEDEDDKIYAFVREDVSGVLDNDCEGKSFLTDENKEILFKLLVDYASTPLEEREEEKIYQFKFVNFGDRWNYLTKSRNDGQFYMDNKVQVGAYQTEFIDSEISEFPTWVYDMIEQGHLIKEEYLNE